MEGTMGADAMGRTACEDLDRSVGHSYSRPLDRQTSMKVTRPNTGILALLC